MSNTIATALRALLIVTFAPSIAWADDLLVDQRPAAWAFPTWTVQAQAFPADWQAPANTIEDLISRYAATGAEPTTDVSDAGRDPENDVVTIVITGDTGFSRNHSKVHPNGVQKYGKRQPWRQAMAGIAGEINGDINFTNIETVVTDRNNLKRDTKGQRGPFNFRSHPNGIQHLVDRGFNVFSLANNHSMDYGRPGLKETLRHVAKLKQGKLKAYAGIGMNRDEASEPQIVNAKGSKVAFAAIGIVTNNLARHRAGEKKPGQIAYRFDSDFELSTKRLAETPGDYHMLSIHYGVEGRVRADARQIKEWRRVAAQQKGIDLIVGHHAHVVRAVERAGDSVIFYGLGNFLHHGTANMGGKGICKDFGLMARVHLLRGKDGKLRTRAVEAIPVTKMHIRTERLPPNRSRDRIHALNYLASLLPSDSNGATGIRFTPQKNGTGLYCFEGAANDAGSIGALCHGWKAPPAVPARLRGQISRSCAR